MTSPIALPRTSENSLLSEARSSASVEFAGVSKDFGSTRVLHEVDLKIEPGEFVSLLGPSGCGKTTALRVLAGLERASSGSVMLGGKDVSSTPTNKRDIGMVFQSYSLFPHLDVAANTAFGLRRRGIGKADAHARAKDALALVGLSHLAERYPHQLSGGQQQRVALARAIVTEPRVLLLDEPLSALDAKVRVQLRDEIRRIQLRLGITTVFVTHDQEEALAVSDRIAVMNDGRIEQIGTPEELYLHPATANVASFVGVSSIVPGTVSQGILRVWDFELPMEKPSEDGEVDVYLRPENIRLVEAGDSGINGLVQESTFLGSFRRTVIAVRGGTLVRVQHAANERVEFDQSVRIAISPTPVMVRKKS